MRIAIIGAGIAGLTAAYEIHKVAPDAHVDVFEAEARVGGKTRTVPFDSGPMDVGAEAFLARNNDIVDFFTELGLADQMVGPSGLRSRVYAQDSLQPIPQGGVMGIPSSAEPVKHLVSAETAARIDAESTAEPIDWQVGQDYSVGRMVRERYGDEVADRVVSALLGGVYSCSADDLGIRATVPQLAEALDALAESGEPVTLSAAVKSIEAERAERARERSADNDGGVGQPAGPPFRAFRGGYADVYDTLAEKCGANIQIDTFISGVEPHKKGGYTVKGGGEAAQEPYDRVLVATPAPTASRLLKKVAPDAAEAMRPIKLASSAVVGLKIDSDTDSAGNQLPENSGLIVALDQGGVHAKAFTFSSRKWPHLAERLDGGVIVRASFGRFGDDAIVRADEDDLVDYALDDLKTITGFDARDAGVSEIFTQRWFGGIPRFDERHLGYVKAARAALADVPGIDVTGAWAGGVGIPNVVADARAAARRIL